MGGCVLGVWEENTGVPPTALYVRLTDALLTVVGGQPARQRRRAEGARWAAGQPGKGGSAIHLPLDRLVLGAQ
jgi:hypothetical protein